MSSNNRILYSCQIVTLAESGHGTITSSSDPKRPTPIHGVQSVGMTTSFNLEQAFELGQIEIYENIEGTPDVEVTLEKVIDGYPLIYLMASTGVYGSSASGLLARSKERCDLSLGIFGEEFDHVAAADTGGAEVEVFCTGMYISSVSYTLPVDGNCTESVTLVGNDKQWLTGANVNIQNHTVTLFDGKDDPMALAAGGSVNNTASGGVQRREDVLMEFAVLPKSIYGAGDPAYGNGYDATVGVEKPIIHLQNVSISTDFSRDDILELGRKTPYYRPANFPIEVSCEIEAISTSGDFVEASEVGDPDLFETKDSGNNTSEETIWIPLRCGICFDLGGKNRLSSVSYGGGDATGGNVSNTYSYTNFNDFDVTQLGHNSMEVMGTGGTSLLTTDLANVPYEWDAVQRVADYTDNNDRSIGFYNP